MRRQRAHQAVARHLGDDRGGGDRHDDARRRRSRRRNRKGASMRSRPSTKRAWAFRAAQRPRAPAPRARRAGCCRDRCAPASQRRPQRRGRADLIEQFLAALGRQPLGIVDASGMRFGSSTTAAATTGPASGPRPASSQPATGQTPRLISARSRRKLGGATAYALGSLACSCRLSCRSSWRTFPESWPGSCESARPAQPGTPQIPAIQIGRV